MTNESILNLRNVISKENAYGQKVYDEKIMQERFFDANIEEPYNFHFNKIEVNSASNLKMHLDFKSFVYFEKQHHSVQMMSIYSVIGHKIPYICEDSKAFSEISKVGKNPKFDITSFVATFFAYDYFNNNYPALLNDDLMKNLSDKEIKAIEDNIKLAERRFINIFDKAANVEYCEMMNFNEDEKLIKIMNDIQETFDLCFGADKVDALNVIEDGIDKVLESKEKESRKLEAKENRRNAFLKIINPICKICKVFNKKMQSADQKAAQNQEFIEFQKNLDEYQDEMRF